MAPGGDVSDRRVKQLVFTPIHVWISTQRQHEVAREWLGHSKRALLEVHASPNRKKNAIKNEEVGRISGLCLCLWLDAIAKALPKGTQIIVEPETDGCEYCWFMFRNGSECKRLSDSFENRKILEKKKAQGRWELTSS